MAKKKNDAEDQLEEMAEEIEASPKTVEEKLIDLVALYRRVLPDRFCEEFEKILMSAEGI